MAKPKRSKQREPKVEVLRSEGLLTGVTAPGYPPETTEEAERYFEASLKNLVDAYDVARELGVIFSPVRARIVEAVRLQLQFLEIGARRRAQHAASAEV
jgi:hypothetical protein